MIYMTITTIAYLYLKFYVVNFTNIIGLAPNKNILHNKFYMSE
jgi:hypothetical protein